MDRYRGGAVPIHGVCSEIPCQAKCNKAEDALYHNLCFFEFEIYFPNGGVTGDLWPGTWNFKYLECPAQNIPLYSSPLIAVVCNSEQPPIIAVCGLQEVWNTGTLTIGCTFSLQLESFRAGNQLQKRSKHYRKSIMRQNAFNAATDDVHHPRTAFTEPCVCWVHQSAIQLKERCQGSSWAQTTQWMNTSRPEYRVYM